MAGADNSCSTTRTFYDTHSAGWTQTLVELEIALRPMSEPSVVVEFYGVPRQRAGVERAEIGATSLGGAIAMLAERFPELAAACFEGNRLHAAYTVNLNGKHFVRDPSTPLADGDVLLMLSTDAGG